MTTARSLADAWPKVNGRVTVGIEVSRGEAVEHLELVSRVEDLGVDEIVVAAPPFAGDLHWPLPGRTVRLSWGGSRGVHHQTCELIAVLRGPVPVWRLRPVGHVSVEQRRRYVRVAANTPALLQLDCGAPAQARVPVTKEAAVLSARMLDLSEGGARILLPENHPLHPATRAVLRTNLDGEDVQQTVEVLRVHRTGRSGPAADEAVLMFVEPVRQADLIRRYVFRLQIDARRQAER